MGKKRMSKLCFVILSQLYTVLTFGEVNEKDTNNDERGQVEVRAVFINCEPDERNLAADSEANRFEREELFKHSVLRDCNKKLALTVKITSEPDTSGDEYLPIEHVFEGSLPNKKRIRLLDPYILRLRREPPLQAYKLRRVDTISGILIDAEGRSVVDRYRRLKSQKRIARDVEYSAKDETSPNPTSDTNPTTPDKSESVQSVIFMTSNAGSVILQPKSCDKEPTNNICNDPYNVTLTKRFKRNEHNIVVEETSDDNKQWNSERNSNQFYKITDQQPVKETYTHSDKYEDRSLPDNNRRRAAIFYKKDATRKSDPVVSKGEERIRLKKVPHSKFRLKNSKQNAVKSGKRDNNKLAEKSIVRHKDEFEHGTKNQHNDKSANEYEDAETENDIPERDYAVYEIGNPELWYTIHLQMFEKLSTPDGKTVWNDLTKGEQASVSSLSPEWIGQDLNVRYRPADWIPREEFSLPTKNLCLLAPIRGDVNSYADNSSFYGFNEDGGYIVVPEEDILRLKDYDENIDKRSDNSSEMDEGLKIKNRYGQGRHRVVVRTSRAMLGGNDAKVNIAFQGSDKYLTMPHRRPHHAQIDLEARADENELVRVGASGRISVAVSDGTRRARTIITLQVGNTGLAAARFRLVTRDCGPAMPNAIGNNNEATVAGPVLIPPRHTRSMHLELPVELPDNGAHCSVTLVNDEDKTIAVRDVTLKKGDRCFCVWHCDCVCLSEDPKLLCREMPDARQTAAGLSTRDRTRHARSCCYKDVITVNIFVVVTGVIMALLVFGLIKAILGLVFRCIGTWGLEQMVQIPRKIDHYYEPSLKCRKVEYDCQGYPVHPDTGERTVRLVSRPMEFMLNVVFFISVPCIVMCDACMKLVSRIKPQQNPEGCCVTSTKCNTNKCYSSHDMQGMAMRWRRRRGGLRRWMTPEAQELSKELWKEGLTPIQCEFMRPLLRNGRQDGLPMTMTDNPEPEHDSDPDSEQDDTDYVLTQMQKSRESLSQIMKQKPKT